MLTVSQKVFALEAIAKQTAKGTRASLARAEKMKTYLERADINSGAFGCIQELASCTERSTKKRVASQGRADTYLKMEVNGKVRRLPVEVKTNGGRISSLRKAGAPRFVAYTLDFKNSNGERHLPQMIVPTEIFLAVLDEYGLTKSTNGTNPEEAIQHTKKALGNWLEDYWMPFDPEAVYVPEDFEEIEI